MPQKRAQAYWNPFDKTGDKTLQNSAKDRFGKLNCRFMYGKPGDAGFLADVRNVEVLLIDGHSGTNCSFIAAKEFGETEKLNWMNLARAIATAGLPQGHLLIKLLGCSGAFCAKLLAQTLGSGKPLGYDYKSIVVGGYTLPVVYGLTSRSVLLKGDEMITNTTNSGLVKWYDINGSEVSKPDLPKWNYPEPKSAYDPSQPSGTWGPGLL